MQRQQIQICLVVMDHTVLDLKYLEAIKGHKSPIYIQTLNSTKLGFIRKLQSRLINKIDPSSPSTPCCVRRAGVRPPRPTRPRS
jgi:hypothetical protein